MRGLLVVLIVAIVNGAIFLQNGRAQIAQVNAQQNVPFNAENDALEYTTSTTSTALSQPNPSPSPNQTLSLGILVVNMASQEAVDATVTLTLRGTTTAWVGTADGPIWFRNLHVGIYTIQLTSVSDGCQTSAISELNFTSNSMVMIPVFCP